MYSKQVETAVVNDNLTRVYWRCHLGIRNGVTLCPF